MATLIDMRKCQNVLTELRFASDLDSTGTIESIVDRHPEHLQNQWVKRSNKILNICLLCVPIMLFVKPIYLHQKYKAQDKTKFLKKGLSKKKASLESLDGEEA